jgi:hypothetical protein
LPRPASNCDLPDLCLLSSWDYSREPPDPGLHRFFMYKFLIFFLNEKYGGTCISNEPNFRVLTSIKTSSADTERKQKDKLIHDRVIVNELSVILNAMSIIAF